MATTLEALDDLVKFASNALSHLRAAAQRANDPEAIGVADQVRSVLAAPQTPDMVKAAYDQLIRLATRLKDSDAASQLREKLKASGLGTNWLTILGLGAGAVAAYFLYQHYFGDRKVFSIHRPEPEDPRPRLKGMSRALGSFQRLGSRRLGAGPRRMNGVTEKYEFEPEIRLEGLRNKRQSRRR